MRLLTKLALLLAPAAALAMPTNPDVTQATVHKTICVPGWTATVRPSTSYTNRIKRELVPDDDIRRYELDHRLPIELGGAPRDPENLWMQPWDGPCGARVKDVLETHLKRQVCAGRVSLRQAQREVYGDWVASYSVRIRPLTCD